MPTLEDGVEVYPYRPPTQQADATLVQANPVSAQLYTILSVEGTAVGTTPHRNVRIISIAVRVDWTVQPTLDVVITIDGQTITYSIAAPANVTYYEAQTSPATTAATQVLGAIAGISPYRAFLCEGKSVLVQARTTGGTTSQLLGRVKWARWQP